MYGDGVDPVEDELIDKTMAVHNLHMAAKRDADAIAVLTAAVSERDRLLLAAEAALERAREALVVTKAYVDSYTWDHCLEKVRAALALTALSAPSAPDGKGE